MHACIYKVCEPKKNTSLIWLPMYNAPRFAFSNEEMSHTLEGYDRFRKVSILGLHPLRYMGLIRLFTLVGHLHSIGVWLRLDVRTEPNKTVRGYKEIGLRTQQISTILDSVINTTGKT